MSEFTANRLVTVNVDVQKDFCPGGLLAVADGDMVIPPLNNLNAFTRRHSGIVIATGDQHPPSTPHFDTWPVHCVAGTEGASFHPALDLRSGDVIIDKGMEQTDGYSGFEGQAKDGRTIEGLIRPRDKESVAVMIGGLATDYCVLHTTLDALEVARQVNGEGRGAMHIFAVRDAMRAVNLRPPDGSQALEQMEAAGATLVDSATILEERAFALTE